MAAHLDWRRTYLVLAVVLAAITVPGHLWGLRGHWPRARDTSGPAVMPTGTHTRLADPGRIARSRAFVVLIVAFAVNGSPSPLWWSTSTLAVAVAPWAGSAIATWLGTYAAMFGVLTAVNVAGVLLILAGPIPRPVGTS